MAGASEISQSIIEFLSSSSAPRVRHCHHCGSIMEYVPVTFHFAGESWDLGLPVCTRCLPESFELIECRRVA
jgi:hypothetical protein